MFNISKTRMIAFPAINLSNEEWEQWIYHDELNEAIAFKILVSIYNVFPLMRDLSGEEQLSKEDRQELFKLVFWVWKNNRPLFWGWLKSLYEEEKDNATGTYLQFLGTTLERPWLADLSQTEKEEYFNLQAILSQGLSDSEAERRAWGRQYMAIQSKITDAFSRIMQPLKEKMESVNIGIEGKILEWEQKKLDKFLARPDWVTSNIAVLQKALLEEGLLEAFTKKIVELVKKPDSKEEPALVLFNRLIADFTHKKRSGLWQITTEAYFGYDWQDASNNSRLAEDTPIRQFSSWVAGAFDYILDEISEKFIQSPMDIDDGSLSPQDAAKMVALYKLWELHRSLDSWQEDSLLGPRGGTATDLYVKFHFQHRLLKQYSNDLEKLGVFVQADIDRKLKAIERDSPSGLPHYVLRRLYCCKKIAELLKAEGKQVTLRAIKKFWRDIERAKQKEWLAEADKAIVSDLHELMKDFLRFVEDCRRSRTEAVFKPSTPLLGIGIGGDFFDEESLGLDYKLAFSFTQSVRSAGHYVDSRIILEILRLNVWADLDSGGIKLPKQIVPAHIVDPEDQMVQHYVTRQIVRLMVNNPDDIAPEIYSNWFDALSKSAWVKTKFEKFKAELAGIENDKKRKESNIIKLERDQRIPPEAVEKSVALLKKEIEELNVKNDELKANCDDFAKILSFSKDQKLSFNNPAWVAEQVQNILRDNLQVYCIEPAVSRHTHDSTYIAIPLAPSHPDHITVSGEPVRLGNYKRLAITPCKRFCQLLAGAHMVWASLTDPEQTLKKLEGLEAAKRQEGMANTAAPMGSAGTRSRPYGYAGSKGAAGGTSNDI